MPPNLWNLQRHCPFNPPAVDIATLERTNDKTCGPWFAKPHIHLRWCMGKWAKRDICSSASIAAPASFQDFPETRCGLWFCHSITTLSTKRSLSSTWNWRNSKECWYQQKWPHCGNLCIVAIFVFDTTSWNLWPDHEIMANRTSAVSSHFWSSSMKSINLCGPPSTLRIKD